MSKSKHSMPKMRNSVSWIIFTLFFAGAIQFLWSCPVVAGQLRDVRIGEHDGYTRIVFEVDTPPSGQPRIDIGNKGQLWIDLGHTSVNLVRKIPVKGNRHINDIKFWYHDGRLSTIVEPDYQHYRFKTFSLGRPPRVAVDIFPMAAQAAVGQAPTTVDGSTARPSPEISLEKNVSQKISEQEAADEARPSERLAYKQVEGAMSRPAETVNLDEAKTQKPIVRATEPDKESKSAPVRSTPQTVFRLQFFLVIGLVVITIGILILLLMMLFARHRFSKVKAKLSASDFLQEQNKKIKNAADDRIKEKFDRYEKA